MNASQSSQMPRPAKPSDADAMAQLVNMAGEGLPYYLWEKMAGDGESPWDIGRARARRDEGAFSWRNTHVIECDDRVVAALVGYPLADSPEPVDYASMPPLFAPMQELEDQAPGTWYVNVLATLPEYRGRGLGSRLLTLSQDLAVRDGSVGLSIIVSSGNPEAMRLYVRHGYREQDRRPMFKESWANPGNEWILLTRPSP